MGVEQLGRGTFRCTEPDHNFTATGGMFKDSEERPTLAGSGADPDCEDCTLAFELAKEHADFQGHFKPEADLDE